MTVLTTKQILNIWLTPPSSRRKGAIEALRRQLHEGSKLGLGGRTPAPAGQRAYIAALREQDVPDRARRQYIHPAHRALEAKLVDGALSPTDIAWIEHLPRNPAEVPWEDARRLAGLALATKVGTPERRLLDTVWGPIQAHHDRKEAETKLANARVTYDPGPAPKAALADAILVEIPEMDRDEAMTRAATLITEATATQERQREIDVYEAEQSIARIDAAVAKRQAPTREMAVR